DIIGDQYALLCTAGLCFCDLEVQCFRSFAPVMTHIDRHAKLLKSESSSDVVPRTCTSAGAGSRSALRSGKIAPIARTDYRRRVAAGRQLCAYARIVGSGYALCIGPRISSFGATQAMISCSLFPKIAHSGCDTRTSAIVQ